MEHKERIRTSISPSGLNASTPDNVVEDGALEVCHNLRFANGAWRNVQEFSAEDIPGALKNKKILYAHPVAGKSNYIIAQSGAANPYTRTMYYAVRSQLMADTPTTQSTSPLAGYSGAKPTTGILTPYSTTYYLDAPLSEARLNPNRVAIYDDRLNRLGVVAETKSNTLLYFDERDIQAVDGALTLYRADVVYTQLGKTFNETFYFVRSAISEAVGQNAVFVKRGDNFVYFGKITSCDAETRTYAVTKREDGIVVACVIPSPTPHYMQFLHSVNINGDDLFYNVYEEYALFMFANEGALGYLSNTAKDMESSSTPKRVEKGNSFAYIYYGKDGEETEFKREISTSTSETDEAYLSRYQTQIDEENQIWGFKLTPCVHYVYPQERDACAAPFYSWEVTDITPSNAISNVYAVPSLDILEEVEATPRALTISGLGAYNSDGEHLGQICTANGEFTIDHFGNMLIVREVERKTTSYYLFSEGKYRAYGNMGNTTLSMDVEVKDQIHSPKMTDVPMFYKAAGFSASDGSLDGRMFLGAGEPILQIDKSDLDHLNPASNLLLIDNENGYFRGELALFAVARAEDGTEIYRTPPQIFRSETLIGDVAVCLYNPCSNEIWERGKEQGYDYNLFPYTYLVWRRKLWDKAVGISKSSYEKWNKWKSKYNRDEKYIKPFLEEAKEADLYKLNVKVDYEGKNIHEIAIYSTRLHPLFVFDKGAIQSNPVRILDEPFYELKVLTNGEKEFELTYNELANIETKTDKLYELTQSGEDTFFASRGIEYNNRYHSYDISTLQPPLAATNILGTSGKTEPTHLVTSRLYNNMGVYAFYPANEMFRNSSKGYSAYATTQQYVLSFQESLREVLFGTLDANGESLTAIGKFLPDYSTTLNCSYIINENKDSFDSDDAGIVFPNLDWTPNSFREFVSSIRKASRKFGKYGKVAINNLEEEETISCTPSYPVRVGNRIQVSDAGNPLTNPYNTSYRVGSSDNEILAIDSVAVKLSDAKFGEFPLYVFTKEGIYAMQTGTDTLYASIIPIAKDVIINPNTLATSGAVLFFTDKGLHMLSQNGVQLISAGLHESNNRIPEWMYTCRMVHLPEYNEVMCLLMDGDETTGKAYVFSLDNNYWSERDVPQGEVLNNFEVIDMESIHNLVNEGESVVKEITLETRPISLGASKELKRLETLVVRFEADKDEPLEVTIKGSIDGVEYKDLRKVSATTNTDVLIRRTPASVKYLKFVVKSSNLQSSIRLIRFDTEHYLRFVRKMR